MGENCLVMFCNGVKKIWSMKMFVVPPHVLRYFYFKPSISLKPDEKALIIRFLIVGETKDNAACQWCFRHRRFTVHAVRVRGDNEWLTSNQYNSCKQSIACVTDGRKRKCSNGWMTSSKIYFGIKNLSGAQSDKFWIHPYTYVSRRNTEKVTIR